MHVIRTSEGFRTVDILLTQTHLWRRLTFIFLL